MGKIQVDHRVILRDDNGKILKDDHYHDFAAAKPQYDVEIEKLKPGINAYLQHGARIIFSSQD